MASQHITQTVTDHGTFKEKLHRLGLSADPRCDYPRGEQTPEHILYECIKYNWTFGFDDSVTGTYMGRTMLSRLKEEPRQQYL